MAYVNDSQRRAYGAPRLKLYGSVKALTAGGTGPTTEVGNLDPTRPIHNCYDGIHLGANKSRKHCL